VSLTPEQIAERREGLGASDASAAVGLSPWKTPLRLYLEKLGEAGEEEHEDALHLQMGHALEPVALEQFCRRTRLSIGDRQKKIVDPDWSQRWVTVDAISSDGGYVEAKSTGFANPAEWGDELEDGAIPMHYLIQAQHGLACSGLAHAWIPLIISNRQFRLYRVTRDAELIALLTEKEREFWARVEARDPPPPANLDDVKLRWPSHQEKQIDATAEIAHLLVEHRKVKEQIKAAESQKEELELQIKSFMGECAEIVDVSGTKMCTWKQAKPTQVFNVDLFATDHPDLYRKYLTLRAGSRRFLNKL